MSIMSESVEPHENWNENLEQVVKREGEQSQSLYWMHNSASVWASKRNDAIQIPAIILASITGFLAASSNLVPSLAIGAMSLIVGILNTINSYYKFAQRSESHKITAQLYLKTYKIIEIELALPVHQRVDAGKLLKKIRETMQHISEVAPAIPGSVINMYRKNFSDSEVSKPIIVNDLEVIVVSKTEPVINVSPVSPVSNINATSNAPVVLTSNISWPSAIKN
jgi:hypothetical protein